MLAGLLLVGGQRSPKAADWRRRVRRRIDVRSRERDRCRAGGANPNPRRVGCPPRRLLIELARRDRSLSDSWYEHFSGCSPCYRAVRALQKDAGEWRGTAH